MKIKAKLLEGSSGGEIIGWGLGHVVIVDSFAKVEITSYKLNAGCSIESLGGAHLFKETPDGESKFHRPIGLMSDITVGTGKKITFSGRISLERKQWWVTTPFLDWCKTFDAMMAPSR